MHHDCACLNLIKITFRLEISSLNLLLLNCYDLKLSPTSYGIRGHPNTYNASTNYLLKDNMIIVVVILVDVGATLPPSNGIHGIYHGATAVHGPSNDANFGCSGSLQMLPHSLCLPFCRPTGAAIPGEEEDDVRVVAAARPSLWQHCPDESTLTPLQSLLLYL
jgi:hypothetical protein